jgi:hypothetical protein
MAALSNATVPPTTGNLPSRVGQQQQQPRAQQSVVGQLPQQRAQHTRSPPSSCSRQLSLAVYQSLKPKSTSRFTAKVTEAEGPGRRWHGYCACRPSCQVERCCPGWPSEYPALLEVKGCCPGGRPSIQIECLAAVCPGMYEFAYNRIDFRQNHGGAE